MLFPFGDDAHPGVGAYLQDSGKDLPPVKGFDLSVGDHTDPAVFSVQGLQLGREGVEGIRVNNIAAGISVPVYGQSSVFAHGRINPLFFVISLKSLSDEISQERLFHTQLLSEFTFC
jgi:hypothetical protein